MITKVYCYSKEIAQKNRVGIPIVASIVSFFVFCIFLVLFVLQLQNADMLLFNVGFLTAVSFFVWLYFDGLIFARMGKRSIGYAASSEGRIFKVVALNTGSGLYLGGLAVGRMVGEVLDDKELGTNIGGFLGFVSRIYMMNKTAKYMSNPEIVSKMVEQFPNVSGAEVYEILKVYYIKERRKTIKLKCDYNILRKNKVKYRKKVIIDKSYINYQDLIMELKKHCV